MKNICLYFQLHQPARLRRYRFFDIGREHYYYDDYQNESTIARLAHNSYLPANKMLLELIKKHPGKFKVSFSISGTMLDLLKLYAPEVIDSFKQLAKTKQVEFLAETNAHSLVSLRNKEEFNKQVTQHIKEIETLFGQTPEVFRNTEMIYSDMLGADVAQMGFKAMLAEGAKQVLGWKSPNYMYCNAVEPRLKTLLKNFVLSDDIAFKFGNKNWSEWPLTAEKYLNWVENLSEKEELINLFMNYETLGEKQKKETGIFDFFNSFVDLVIKKDQFSFTTPSVAAATLQPISAVVVPNPTSWADEERDLSPWMDNELQNEALDKLYDLVPMMNQCSDPVLIKDWQYLQASDHFYYMSTKFFSSGVSKAYQNPYDTPYDAFINYMNVLSDFTTRLKDAVGETPSNHKLEELKREIEKKEAQIKELENQLEGKPAKPTSKAKSRTTADPVKKVAAPKAEAKKEVKKKEPAKKVSEKKETIKKESDAKAPVKKKTTASK